ECGYAGLVETAATHPGRADLLQLAFSRRAGCDNGSLAGRLARRAVSLSLVEATEKDSYAALRLTDFASTYRQVRLGSSIFARLASEVFLSSPQNEFFITCG